jgi:cell division protein FtsZ
MVKISPEFIPETSFTDIKVIGLGGGGGNAVNYMYNQGIKGVEFIICNTDNQALESSPITNKIQIGNSLTGGRGVGGNPELGRRAAMEDIEKIKEAIGENTKMLFVTTGLGGGTGTGAAPVVAKLAREMDILTVGIVTYPFKFEGPKRIKVADEGQTEMNSYVDALITIHNDRLLEMFKGLGIGKAFSYADNVLAIAAKGIAEIITVTGIMNVDFEDVKAIMKDSGTAIMGSAVAEGEDRAIKVVSEALNSPLLKEKDIRGAKHILLNLSYGSKEVQVDELNIITDYIENEVGTDVDMKFGHCQEESLGNKLSITIIATSLDKERLDRDEEEIYVEENVIDETESSTEVQKEEKIVFSLNDEKEDEGFAEEQLKIRYREPYIKKDEEEEHYQELSYKSIRTPQGLEKSESVPAYIRRKIKLEDLPHSSEDEVSRYYLDDNNEEKKPEIKKNNSYLSDNVD